jgi:hypothetical protein
VNKNLYDKVVELPEEVTNYLSQCFDAVPDSDANVEGHNRNQELRNSGSATYQQLQRIDNWFRSYPGNKEDAPYILNGGDYFRNWVTQKIDELQRGDEAGRQVQADYVPDDVNDDLIDDMGWLSNMNRPSKNHSKFNDDIKITESLKRITEIMKKII